MRGVCKAMMCHAPFRQKRGTSVKIRECPILQQAARTFYRLWHDGKLQKVLAFSVNCEKIMVPKGSWMASKTIVLLGGLGFIGSELTTMLLGDGWTVKIIDRYNERKQRRWKAASRAVQIFDLSIAQTKATLEIIAQADVCIHLAHGSRPNIRVKSLTQEIRETVIPTLKLLAGLRKKSLGTFLFFSSGGTVYGIARELPIRESHPTQPISAYGKAKLMLEHSIHYFCIPKGICPIILRPANVYGTNWFLEKPQGAVEVFLRQLLQNAPIVS